VANLSDSIIADPMRPSRVRERGVRMRAGVARALFGGLSTPRAALIGARVDLALWVPMALSLGIGAYFLAPVEPGPLVYGPVALIALIGVALWRAGPEAGQFLAALMALAACGFLLASVRTHSVAAPVLGYRYYGPVEGRIIRIDRSSRDRIRLTLDQVVLDNTAPARTPGLVRVSLQGDQSRLEAEPGLRVMLTAHLSPPAGPAEPGAYDFRRYAWFSGLGAVGYTRTPVLVLAPPDPSNWLLAGHRARMRLSAALQAQIPGQAGAVASALLTGDRSGIAEATNASMRASNLYHIVSISGLHMGMLAGFVFAMVRYGLALVGTAALRLPGKKIAAMVALIAASFYLWLAGPEVATQRAYLMAAVMLIAVLFDRRAISLRTVAIAAMLLLVAKPESLTEPGFQMSFGATVALILIYKPWARVQPHVPVLLRPVAMLLVSSLAAGFSTSPIAAAHFNRMSEYGLLANLLAVPVMGTLVMPAGVIAALLAPFGLAAPALWVMEKGTVWMIAVSDWVGGMEGAVIAVPAPGAAVLPLMAIGAMVAVLARGAVRTAALALLLTAFALWCLTVRPDLLISPEAELVGLMTPEGRAMSKPGAGFVADSWLEADGDTATFTDAAARAAFAGPKGWRTARFGLQEVVHLTGKTAADHLAEVCHDGAIVVLAARGKNPPGDCDLYDFDRLRQTGAVAFTRSAGLLRRDTSAEMTGVRPWAPAARQRY